jgi:hypothetical protein
MKVARFSGNKGGTARYSSSFAHNLVMSSGRGFFLLFYNRKDIAMSESNETMQECHNCGVKLPLMAEPGRLNFCPAAIIKDGETVVIYLCMECKASSNR